MSGENAAGSDRAKAIFEPSGDHEGSHSSYPEPAVRLTRPDPSAFMTWMSKWASSSWPRTLAKAIFEPSGENDGEIAPYGSSEGMSAPSRVRRLTLDPSASITY